ncbi:uncharacterized protein EpC_14830 [Erwinia pyrifoliae Ep1/96]|nr:uncharacterized protein EpC_14830 [Erwinia pyrifoliae Ep1/96]
MAVANNHSPKQDFLLLMTNLSLNDLQSHNRNNLLPGPHHQMKTCGLQRAAISPVMIWNKN